MILTNAQMFDSLEVLSKAEETGLLGFAIARNRQKLTDETRAYAEKRDELLRQYGWDIGEGRFQLEGEAVTKFMDALNPYGEIEVEVNVMQVSQDVFYSGALTSSQMFTLGWMVKD